MNCKDARTRGVLEKSIIKSNTYNEIVNTAAILAVNLPHFAHPPRLCASALRFARLRGEALQ
jgi:hypothetical protein